MIVFSIETVPAREGGLLVTLDSFSMDLEQAWMDLKQGKGDLQQV